MTEAQRKRMEKAGPFREGSTINRNRGWEPYPHWHDAKTWATKTTMRYDRFLGLGVDGFVEWCRTASPEEYKGLFYGICWPEGETYCRNSNYAAFAYTGMCKRASWPDDMLTSEEGDADYGPNEARRTEVAVDGGCGVP